MQECRNADNNNIITHQARLLLATKVGTNIVVLMNYKVLKFNSNIPNNTSRGQAH